MLKRGCKEQVRILRLNKSIPFEHCNGGLSPGEIRRRYTFAVSPKQRIVLLNAGVLGGLVVSYLRGAPLWIIAICGVFLLALANGLAIIKIRNDQAKARVSG